VRKLAFCDRGNPVSSRPKAKANLEIENIHKKEVGAKHAYYFHDLSAHHAPGCNGNVGEPYRLSHRFLAGFGKPVAPKHG
jgi:hypothetical protein